jgi:carboxylesterase
VPILILHGRNDTQNSPKGAELLYSRISTPEAQKRLVWFEKTDHDMFNDCEWETVINTVGSYIEERLA